MLTAVLAVGIMPIIAAVLIWKYASGYIVDPKLEESMTHRMKAFCPVQEHFETTSRYNLAFQQSGVIGFTSGSILGHLFEMKFVKINLSYSLWNQTAIFPTVLRIFASLVFYLLFSLPYFLVSSAVPESQIPYLYLIKFFLPTFLAAFLLFAFARVIFMRLKLINDRAIGCQFETPENESEEYGGEENTGYAGSSSVGPVAVGKNGSLEFVEIEMVSRI